MTPHQIVNAEICIVTAQDVLDCIRAHRLSTNLNVVEGPAMDQLSYSASTSIAKSAEFSFNSKPEGSIAEIL